MTHLTNSNFNREVEQHEGLVVIDLFATWCGPCRMLAPVLDELEGEMPEVKFCKINVDDEPELAKLFKVTSIPMVAVVKDNTMLDFFIGYRQKTDVADFIGEYR